MQVFNKEELQIAFFNLEFCHTAWFYFAFMAVYGISVSHSFSFSASHKKTRLITYRLPIHESRTLMQARSKIEIVDLQRIITHATPSWDLKNIPQRAEKVNRAYQL